MLTASQPGDKNMVGFAAEVDLERVNELRRQVHSVHAHGRPDIFTQSFDSEMQNLLYDRWRQDEHCIIVAKRGGVLCGFAYVNCVDVTQSPYRLPRAYYHIEEFGVDEAYRRQGVATELFRFIRQDAKEKGLDRIELDMWEFNEAALRFYEAVGFCTYRRYMEYREEPVHIQNNSDTKS